MYRDAVSPARLLAAVVLGLSLLAAAPARAATVTEPPVAACSGKADDPCTARAKALAADVKRAQEIALEAPGQARKAPFRRGPGTPLVVLQALLGVALLLGLGWVFSADRKAVRWRPVIWGLALQAAFALIVLSPGVGDLFFRAVDAGVRQLLGFAEAGMTFVLQGVEPHTATHVAPPGHWVVNDVIVGRVSPAVKTIAFWVFPTIIFFSALLTLLYHLGIMQWVVRGIAALMRLMLGTSGAETLSCAANVFLGQTEAPLLVKPFVKDCTPSELHAIMVGGFATVSGGVLALYVAVLRDIPGIAGHLVAASFMGAPGALALSKLMFPETGRPLTAGGAAIVVERPDANAIEALARGATEGMTLLLNVVAMLIAFVALVALVNGLLGAAGDAAGLKLSLERLLGWVLAPLAWAMGVPWADASTFGELLGKKLVLTELLAYLDLQRVGPSMSERSAVMATYALCGFANVASIGIQIGGIGEIGRAHV